MSAVLLFLSLSLYLYIMGDIVWSRIKDFYSNSSSKVQQHKGFNVFARQEEIERERDIILFGPLQELSPS